LSEPPIFWYYSPGFFAMRRIQFIEIHEQPWFPSFLRDDVTDALQYGFSFLQAYAPVGPLLRSALHSTKGQAILDLCSGGGGPWLDLSRNLKWQAGTDQIRLSDKFPNLRAFQNVRTASGNQITFSTDSVDALKVPRELSGFRTIFSSYHHFPPEEARAVLQDAVDAGEGIGIFEVTRRGLSAIGLMFPWSLMALVLTPWMRPFRWTRLFWTYVIPMVPFVVWFDGVISCLRSYRPDELREIIGKLSGREYEWRVGEFSGSRVSVPITYLIGCPRARA
jgi:hypothetical protein